MMIYLLKKFLYKRGGIMKEISTKQAKEIYGGGLTAMGYAAIAAGISFIVGIFDGITRTLRCFD